MRGLNSRPLRYKHNALPTELMELMVIPGFEPGIQDSKSRVLTTTLYDQTNVIKRYADLYTTLDYSNVGIRTQVCGLKCKLYCC
jgi:hypothetical protein